MIPISVISRLILTAALVATVFLGFNYVRGLQRDLKQAEVDLNMALSANENNDAVIEKLAAENRKCVEDRKADKVKADKAVERWNTKEAELRRRAEENAGEVNKVFNANKGCAELSNLRVGDLCPEYVDRLFQATSH